MVVDVRVRFTLPREEGVGRGSRKKEEEEDEEEERNKRIVPCDVHIRVF